MNEKSEIVLTLEISDLDIKCISYYIARCSLQSPITLRFQHAEKTLLKNYTRERALFSQRQFTKVCQVTHICFNDTPEFVTQHIQLGGLHHAIHKFA